MTPCPLGLVQCVVDGSPPALYDLVLLVLMTDLVLSWWVMVLGGGIEVFDLVVFVKRGHT